MSSSQSDKKGSAARAEETGLRTSSSDPIAPDVAPACLPVSFLLGINWLAVMPKKVSCDPTPSVEAGVPLAPDALAQPSSCSTTPGPVAEKEQTVETMPPPPVKREIVLALRAPSATPGAPPKGMKRSCTTSETTKKKRCIKSEEGETSLRGGTGLLTLLIGDCGSKVGRLSKELANSREAPSQPEAKLKIVEESHATETSQLEIRISDLERDLGKTASSLLKVRQEKKAKSSEVRHLQCRIQSEEGSKGCEVTAAATALRAKFETSLTKIAGSLDSLMVVRNSDVALASVDGSLSGIQLVADEGGSSPTVEEVKLSARREELAAIVGDFNAILAGLKSECNLFSDLDELKEQCPLVETSGDETAPHPNDAGGEGEGVGEDDVPASRYV
ncbi:hypothetical protein DY000_02047951 [Brassica cretica]|uniref:Uncharacterized protein n=1 Tax=Brassica cretica TaxID=69181 RepID=A0ABQ7EZT8_BRACR|nr:hypothetical protein DY000_02047951 [Brassica cretica]